VKKYTTAMHDLAMNGIVRAYVRAGDLRRASFLVPEMVAPTWEVIATIDYPFELHLRLAEGLKESLWRTAHMILLEWPAGHDRVVAIGLDEPSVSRFHEMYGYLYSVLVHPSVVHYRTDFDVSIIAGEKAVIERAMGQAIDDLRNGFIEEIFSDIEKDPPATSEQKLALKAIQQTQEMSGRKPEYSDEPWQLLYALQVLHRFRDDDADTY